MVRDKFSISWGDTGTKPTDGEDFESGERPDAQKFDWKWYNTIDKINKIWDELTRLDSDDDGQVDAADTADYANDADASTYKGNDIDSDGDGKIDAADTADNAGDADTVDGWHKADIQTWVNNNVDVSNVDYADSAGDVAGTDGSQHQAGSLPRFSDESTGLSNTEEGDLFYNESNNSVYLNDGT